ncbi:DNAj [Anaeramoeba ignava]|uniref:DNAj n=1 Tax=Anaeramoeba ignava TaxID=1746090 RepID=A0A9Q0LLR7_ANAIG|nr:DNAj [Anaeramoeba ignava]
MFNTQNYFLDQEFQSTKNLFEIFQKEQKEKNLNQFENPNQKKNETKNLKKKKEIKRILEKNSLYEILQENQFSSENKIGNSLKKIGEKIHPDKCLENGSERAFKKLVIAGSILSDSNKKLKYSQNQNINLFSQTNQALELFPEEFNPRFNPRNYFNNFPSNFLIYFN